jgi:hypothetical protein
MQPHYGPAKGASIEPWYWRYLGMSPYCAPPPVGLVCKKHDRRTGLHAARRSWASRHRHDGSAEGEDPWLCDPGFRRVCLCRCENVATVRFGPAPVKVSELPPAPFRSVLSVLRSPKLARRPSPHLHTGIR